jgi:hypothetical protein
MIVPMEHEVRGHKELRDAVRDLASQGAGFYLDAPPDGRGRPRRYVACETCDAVLACAADVVSTTCSSCSAAQQEGAVP